MNFNELENTWAKQVPSGDVLLASALQHRLGSEVRHERRRVLGAIIAIGFALLIGWIVTLGAHLSGIRPFTSGKIISLAAGSLLDAAFFVVAIRSTRRIQKELHAMGESLVAAAHASLRTIESRRQDYTVAAYAFPVVVLLSTVLAFFRYQAGDLRGLAVVANGVGGLVLASILLFAMWRRYRTHLAPRREELRQLIASLREME
jgi:hypothetical protein